jgi:hypothetical protein
MEVPSTSRVAACALLGLTALTPESSGESPGAFPDRIPAFFSSRLRSSVDAPRTKRSLADRWRPWPCAQPAFRPVRILPPFLGDRPRAKLPQPPQCFHILDPAGQHEGTVAGGKPASRWDVARGVVIGVHGAAARRAAEAVLASDKLRLADRRPCSRCLVAPGGVVVLGMAPALDQYWLVYACGILTETTETIFRLREANLTHLKRIVVRPTGTLCSGLRRSGTGTAWRRANGISEGAQPWQTSTENLSHHPAPRVHDCPSMKFFS